MLSGRTRNKSQSFLNEIRGMKLSSYLWNNLIAGWRLGTNSPVHKGKAMSQNTKISESKQR